MRITLGQLRSAIRRIVEHGVDTEMRNTAGFFMAGGVSSNVTDREAIMNPVPGLGDPDEQEEDQRSNEPQKKSQLALRYADRHPAG